MSSLTKRPVLVHKCMQKPMVPTAVPWPLGNTGVMPIRLTPQIPMDWLACRATGVSEDSVGVSTALFRGGGLPLVRDSVSVAGGVPVSTLPTGSGAGGSSAAAVAVSGLWS